MLPEAWKKLIMALGWTTKKRDRKRGRTTRNTTGDRILTYAARGALSGQLTGLRRRQSWLSSSANPKSDSPTLYLHESGLFFDDLGFAHGNKTNVTSACKQ